MDSSEYGQRVEKASSHCRFLIDYYEKRRKLARINYTFFQASAIILSGLTPVLILVTEIPKLYQALPAALASIASGFVVAFHFQENWVTCKNTAEALKAELLSFETRTGEWYRVGIPKNRALENFLSRIEGIHKGEISAWAAMQRPQALPSEDSK
jgi:hypothetical protein